MVLLLSYSSRIIEDNMMKGFWCADPAFCQKAELDMFVLYLGDSSSYIRNNRYGYMLAANDQGIILNNTIKITFSGATNIKPGLATEKSYNVSVDWDGDKPADDEAFPSECKATYYPLHGKLVFYKGDQIIVSLWKDNQMSSLKTDIRLDPADVILKDNDTGDL
jgi:hypothetical protein